jgi:hypothetical protein
VEKDVASVRPKDSGRVAGWAGYVLCAAGFVLTVWAFYPGLMSPDSIDQWAQGRAWVFNDVHPPLMAAVWGLSDRVWAGPAPMLVFHNLMFWGGAALFWRATREAAPRLSLVFAALGFMPQVLALLSMVWKDVGLGAALFLASALLYGAGRHGWRFAVFAACPLLFYGYAVRLNAAPAVLPLAVWSAHVACRQFPKLRARADAFRLLPAALGLAYFALLTLGVVGVTRALTKGQTLYPYQQILLHDLAAVSKEEGRPLFPQYVTGAAGFSHERVSENYSDEWVNSLLYVPQPPLSYTRDPEQVASLRAAWWDAVSTHKLAYLKHRWAVYRKLTGFGTEIVYKSFNPATGMNNPPPFRRAPGALTRALTSYFFFFSNSIFFRGFVWILVCLALCYFPLRLGLTAGDLGAAFALASSGLLFALAYFFVTPSSEFRYLWWTMLAGASAAVLFAAHLSAHREVLRGRRAVLSSRQEDGTPARS